MTTYSINFTDVNITPIDIEEFDIDTTSTDVTLFGRIRLEYGELLNENLLHLVENFSCPEDPANLGNPHLDTSFDELLANPVEGQLWHNSTTGVLFYWDGTYWIPIRGFEDVAANWGTISHGQQLPQPQSASTGYIFPYDECIWSVSERSFDSAFDTVNVTTDLNDSTVTMEYSVKGSSDTIQGVANYLIIGIRNATVLAGPPPTPSPSPVVTLTTPAASGGPVVTPTPTISEIVGTLNIVPSACDPGTPGPGGTETKIYDTCGNISRASFDKSIYLSINLKEFVPPVSVDFSNIIFDPSDGGPTETSVQYYNVTDPNYACHSDLIPDYPNPQEDDLGNSDLNYWHNNCYPDSGLNVASPGGNPLFGRNGEVTYGGSGTYIGNNIFVISGTVIGSTIIAYARYRPIARHFYYGFDWKHTVHVRGYILVTDDAGNFKRFYVPYYDGPGTDSGSVDEEADRKAAAIAIGMDIETGECSSSFNDPLPDILSNGWRDTWHHWGLDLSQSWTHPAPYDTPNNYWRNFRDRNGNFVGSSQVLGPQDGLTPCERCNTFGDCSS